MFIALAVCFPIVLLAAVLGMERVERLLDRRTAADAADAGARR